MIHKLIKGQKNKWRIKVGTSVSDLASQRNTSVRTFIPLKLMIPSLIDSQGKLAAAASCRDADKRPDSPPPLPKNKKKKEKNSLKNLGTNPYCHPSAAEGLTNTDNSAEAVYFSGVMGTAEPPRASNQSLRLAQSLCAVSQPRQ